MESHPTSTIANAAQSADAMNLLGLCVNCEHRDSCAFREKSGQPVQFCEEFSISNTQMNATPSSEPVIVSKAKKVSLYTGLCINCEHREDCTYVENGAGGWFCEEYA